MRSARLRPLFVLALAAGTPTLPACGLPQFLQRDTPKPPPAPATAGTEFKSLPPGQRVSKAEVGSAPPLRSVEADEPPNPIVPAPPVPAAPMQASATEAYPTLFREPKPRGPRPDGPLVEALRAHLDNQYGAAVNHLSGFDKPNQELFLLLLPLLDAARTADLTGRDPRSAAGLAKQIDVVAELVNRTAPLEIKTTAFVYKVDQYGVYDPLPAGYGFLPGGTGRLYAEIDHATESPAVQSNGDRGYVTKLEGSIQLKDAAGQVVGLYDVEKGKMVPELPFKRADFTRSPVRDFFLKVEFPIPEKPGKYSLVLEIRDPPRDPPEPAPSRRTRKVIEFQVTNERPATAGTGP